MFVHWPKLVPTCSNLPQKCPSLQAIQTPQATRCVAVATGLRADVDFSDLYKVGHEPSYKWSDPGPLQMAVKVGNWGYNPYN